MIEVCLDYVDRRVARKREMELELPDKSVRLVADRLAVKLFERLKMDYEVKNYYKTVYHSTDKALYVPCDDEFECGIEHKGAWFNLPDWNKKYDDTTQFLRENGAYYHFTRVDLAFTTTENLFSLVKKIDFKNLLIKSYERKGELENITGENSRIGIVFYDKTKQLKKVKNQDYLNNFRQKYPQPQVYRFEIRLKGKDTLEKLGSLYSEKIHLKEVAKEILEATEKRVVLPRKLKKKLWEAVNAIK